uniref:Retrotransposon protein, putative, Ty3-gypsy subclass n=1 Tax=Oryza sativa subsp. japonica TaxID=39947 RepID=Q2QSS7_ORYSJ|nr:retrotransposon protein, putative, Ty3-gypsy subclass [Oryza sativa Japonica Group]
MNHAVQKTDPDDISGDVISGDGSAARARKLAGERRRFGTNGGHQDDRERRGELTGDQRSGGGAADGDGVEEKAAALFGLTTATVLRRLTANAKGRTRMATRRRPRWRAPRATAMTGATAARGWSDGGARLHVARALQTSASEGEGGGG